MEASKFIADMGLDRARHLVNEAGEKHSYYNTTLRQWQQFSKPDGDLIYLPDLKRLVKSHELVASWGGLADAKVAVKVSRHKKYLKRAIADVEACSKKPQ